MRDFTIRFESKHVNVRVIYIESAWVKKKSQWWILRGSINIDPTFPQPRNLIHLFSFLFLRKSLHGNKLRSRKTLSYPKTSPGANCESWKTLADRTRAVYKRLDVARFICSHRPNGKKIKNPNGNWTDAPPMASTVLIPKEELTKKQVKEEEEEANVLCWELGSASARSWAANVRTLFSILKEKVF